jgi:hypothetical protein
VIRAKRQNDADPSLHLLFCFPLLFNVTGNVVGLMSG